MYGTIRIKFEYMISLSINQKIIIAVLFLLGSLYAFQKTRIQTTHDICRKCNVIIVSFDLLRASELPCYGYVHDTMPRLCQFAENNIRFTNTHAQSTRTLPNETSLFTSLYESNHGINNVAIDHMHPSIETLSGLYKKAGYHTIFVGTGVDGNIPLFDSIKKSFDTIIIPKSEDRLSESNEWIKALTKIEQKNPSDPPIFLYIYSDYIQAYHQEDIFTEKRFVFDSSFQAPVISGLFTFHEQTLKNTKEQLRYNVYKKNGHLSPDVYKRLLSALDMTQSLSQAKRIFETLPLSEQRDIYYHELNDYLDATNPLHRTYMRNLYDNRLKNLDTLLTPFFDHLENSQIIEKTIVAFLSDHGESLGDNGLFGHSKTPYEIVTHVPLVMHVPTITQKTYTPIIQLVDLMPTLLHLSGIRTPTHIAGRDISGLFWNQALLSPFGSYAITEEPGTRVQSIRTDTWRLIIHRGDPGPAYNELYNLTADPTETHDVSDEQKDVVIELTKKLDTIIHMSPIFPHIIRPTYTSYSNN